MNPHELTYIHYGSKRFNALRFKQVRNHMYPFVKPRPETGLWASPVDSSFGWKDWCELESFRNCSPNNSFSFQLSSDARVFVINDIDDLEQLPWLEDRSSNGPDYESIREIYDVLFLTEEGQYNTRLTYPKNLYGWDCECILVMNNVLELIGVTA